MANKEQFKDFGVAIKTMMKLSGCLDEELAEIFVLKAADLILNYTWRKTLIPELESCVVDLAVIAYNRMGTEGETSRSEGGIGHAFVDGVPNDIKAQLNRYIKAKVVGYEAETE